MVIINSICKDLSFAIHDVIAQHRVGPHCIAPPPPAAPPLTLVSLSSWDEATHNAVFDQLAQVSHPTHVLDTSSTLKLLPFPALSACSSISEADLELPTASSQSSVEVA